MNALPCFIVEGFSQKRNLGYSLLSISLPLFFPNGWWNQYFCKVPKNEIIKQTKQQIKEQNWQTYELSRRHTSPVIFLWLSRRSSELEIRMLRFNPRLGIIFSLVTKRMTYFPIQRTSSKFDICGVLFTKLTFIILGFRSFSLLSLFLML